MCQSRQVKRPQISFAFEFECQQPNGRITIWQTGEKSVEWPDGFSATVCHQITIHLFNWLFLQVCQMVIWEFSEKLVPTAVTAVMTVTYLDTIATVIIDPLCEWAIWNGNVQESNPCNPSSWKCFWRTIFDLDIWPCSCLRRCHYGNRFPTIHYVTGLRERSLWQLPGLYLARQGENFKKVWWKSKTTFNSSWSETCESLVRD